MPRPDIDLRRWHHAIPYLWMLLGEAIGCPKFCGNGFDVHAPSLPVVGNVPLPDTTHSAKTQICDFKISFASANVSTLGVGSRGHAGKLDYIQGQFVNFHLNFLGVQEARTKEGTIHKGNILRLCSGPDGKFLGVELWCNLAQPFAFLHGRPQFLKSTDFQVLHRDPRCLLVSVRHSLWEAYILVGHAPHSGTPLAHRALWWNALHAILLTCKPETPIVALLDANAGPGECDFTHVLGPGFAHTSGTPLLRNFLDTFGLCLPSTSALHTGPRHTWTAPDGDSFHCIDFVAVPHSWLPWCQWSQSLEDFDLNVTHEDHLPVGLEIGWTSSVTCKTERSTNAVPAFDRGSIGKVDLTSMLSQNGGFAWNTDIEQHVDGLNHIFISALKQHCPKPPQAPKKPFIDQVSWQLRHRKLRLRKVVRQVSQRLDHETLSRVFSSWKAAHGGVGTEAEPLLEASFHYGTMLRCSGLRVVAQLWITCRRLKKQLQTSKKQVLANRIEGLQALTSASDILRTLRPFVGSSNAKNKGPRPLPFVRDADGYPCASHDESVDRWIDFFMQMEGGQRIETPEQRRLWIQNLHEHTADHLDVNVQEVPTLVELEAAFRRVKKGKATGPDHLPSELFHAFPATLARQCYSVLLKIALQGQECLMHKGGTLVPLWKGKGDQSLCSSYRSILLSSHFGKSLHRTLRLKQADVYEAFIHSQQLGGRRRTPVTLGAHQARAFLRHHRQEGRPTALLFLDLTEAFYRVVRPLALSGTLDDEVLAAMAQRLHLDENVISELHDLLCQPGAIENAQLPEHAQRAIRAIHCDTHFSLRGQMDRCRTTLGTRPGDAYADVVFGYLWARVLHRLQDQLVEIDLCESVPVEHAPKWFGSGPSVPSSFAPFIGPCWCDDLCVCVSSHNLESLQNKIATVSGMLLDLCRTHGMTPNLQKGKTELMFSARGPGQKAFRHKWFGADSTGTFPVIGEAEMYHLPLVGHYRHLGGFLHHSGDMKLEVRRRMALAHQTFSQHRKLLLQNLAIPLRKRVDLFRCLVMSRFLYATESWILHDQKTKDFVHAAIVRLYKRLLKLPADARVTDEWIFVQTGLPSPAVLLRVSRLRYLRTLFATGETANWGVLNLDTQWNSLIEDDLVWMFEQLWNSSPLGDPRAHLPQWIDFLRWHPGYWKRLVSRAMKHHIAQNAKVFQVQQAHQEIFNMLREHGLTVPCVTFNKPLSDKVFGCMSCKLACRSRAGEGAHMFKTHGITNPIRKLFQTTQCAICLKDYHSFGRLKHHLLRSEGCRQQWHSLKSFHAPLPGIGSQADDEMNAGTDRLVPPVQAAGPFREFQGRSDFSAVDEALYEDLALDILHATDDSELIVQLRQRVLAATISWTTCSATLDELRANLESDGQDLGDIPLQRVLRIVSQLQSPEAWPFLTEETYVVAERFPDLGQLEDACGGVRWNEETFTVPRPWGKHRIVLHAFAGRRRPGDFQYYLDRLLAESEDGVYIHAVSMDIIYDATLGDASLKSTQDFWFWGIDKSWVVGFLGGPPCESWSKARGAALPGTSGRSGPRIIRTASELWGKAALGLKELAQITLGNELLLFSIACIYRLALRGGMAILEHPAEPDEDDAASIWRLQILILLTHLPGVEVLRIFQGHFGAPTPKPTNLLCLNLPGLKAELDAHAVSSSLPRRAAIGRQEDGSWATSRLKEYPPALCFAFASCFFHHLQGISVTACTEEADHFLSMCQSLLVQSYSAHFGQDFAG